MSYNIISYIHAKIDIFIHTVVLCSISIYIYYNFPVHSSTPLQARQWGHEEMFLEVVTSNVRARNLYEKLGFFENTGTIYIIYIYIYIYIVAVSYKWEGCGII